MPSSCIFPNFLILGAAKSGTTALYQYLVQHPQVFMSSPKEPSYFCYEGQTLSFGGPPSIVPKISVTQLEAYQDLFVNAGGYKAVGEASPFYLFLPQTAANIHKKIPNVRMIAILRNPADRIFSTYQFLVRDEREPLELRAALDAQPQRDVENWDPIYQYVRFGFYAEQLERYYALFAREQLHVVLYDDFVNKPLSVIQEIFEFIGVDSAFEPDMSDRPNISGKPKNRLLHTLTYYPNPIMSIFKKIAPKPLRTKIKMYIYKKNLRKIHFDPAVRTYLIDIYRLEILKLQDVLKRDLSVWLDDKPHNKPRLP